MKEAINARIDGSIAVALEDLRWKLRKTKTEIIEAALREYIERAIEKS